MQNEQYVYLDTETTGLMSTDEVLEIAIVDDEGRVLVDTLCKPRRLKTWSGAEEIHGISPGDVVNAPALDEIGDLIREAVKGKVVVIYNAAYDLQYVDRYLDTAAGVECCMLKYAERVAIWDFEHNGWRWHKLVDAAAAVDHVWTGVQHRARADAQACGAVWRFLLEHEKAAI